MPPAPGRLSMTTCWPQASVSFWPMKRARMSVLPPGVNGTISLTGLVGIGLRGGHARTEREDAPCKDSCHAPEAVIVHRFSAKF